MKGRVGSAVSCSLRQHALRAAKEENEAARGHVLGGKGYVADDDGGYQAAGGDKTDGGGKANGKKNGGGRGGNRGLAPALA